MTYKSETLLGNYVCCNSWVSGLMFKHYCKMPRIFPNHSFQKLIKNRLMIFTVLRIMDP